MTHVFACTTSKAATLLETAMAASAVSSDNVLRISLRVGPEISKIRTVGIG